MSNNQYAIASLSQSPTLSTLQGIVIQTISICTNKEIKHHYSVFRFEANWKVIVKLLLLEICSLSKLKQRNHNEK